MQPERQRLIRSLFDEYIEMYASRDQRLTTRFSENFSGYAGSSDQLVTDREEWIRVTRLDFAQVPGRIRIEMLDLAPQDLAEDVVAVTAFFHIHLPQNDPVLARETARLVLVFRREGEAWMIAHSGISIPFGLAREGEVYPMRRLQERNQELEALVEERTQALKVANDALAAHRCHLETEVEQRTAALSIAKEAAEAANRAKTTFLTTVSHELRTPMNAIMGMTTMARSHATDPTLIHRLTVIDGASRRLLAVINDILDISRLEAERLTLECKDFKLADILESITGTLGRKAGDKGLQLAVHVPPEVSSAPLRGDPLRLEQILLNLADNAVKFTEQGRINLRAGLTELGPDSVKLSVEVQDSGIGIAGKDIDRLFSLFEQGDGSLSRKYGGTGLGLAISKRLAQLMGGDIRVSSEAGVGSTFSLTVRLNRAAGN
ncbi:ATP-binding protein [Azonexus sp. IMCC34842]|uniref:ATP-binding protein n=1 Tax=Azonexus sp. IMCC34842 TaxID=3420950 RepID=UPI003D14A798